MFPSIVALAFSVSSIVLALPSTDSSTAIDAGLRLIKTSETDPGTWVTEEQKIVDYVAQGIYFIDITDIKVRSLRYWMTSSKLTCELRMKQHWLVSPRFLRSL